jgi:hypothetical protein
MTDGVVTPIASRAEFHEAVRSALAHAAETDASEICIVDPDFNDWPLNERAIVASLAQWATSRHKLTVFAKSFDEMARRHSRFVDWRRQWSHIVQCRTDDDLEGDSLPTLLFVPGLVSVRLLDRVRYRGLASGRPADLVESRESIDALLQRSTEAFPATTLGL